MFACRVDPILRFWTRNSVSLSMAAFGTLVRAATKLRGQMLSSGRKRFAAIEHEIFESEENSENGDIKCL